MLETLELHSTEPAFAQGVAHWADAIHGEIIQHFHHWVLTEFA